GYKEHIYQKAIAQELEEVNIKFKKELPIKIIYKGNPIGIYYLDFLIEEKIILEVKVRNYFSRKDIEQLYSYLKTKNLKLGIIAHFTRSGVKFKRVVNLK
ncbi:GxxExxY protein, partial [bacterium]|nr:GxxExxY protein [bacterium]